MAELLYHARDGNASDGGNSYVCVSFRDLPIATHQLGLERLPPPPSSGDYFEFFSGGLSGGGGELCSAAEIFSQGKLLPLRRDCAPAAAAAPAEAPPLERWRSASVGAIQQRPGRLAAENSKLKRASSDPSPPVVAPRLPPSSPSSTPSRASPTTRRLFALVSVVKPATMEARDMRRRQQHRQARASPTKSEKEESERWREGRSGPWKILRALSCSGTESSAVVVPAPVGLVQSVRV